MAETQTEQAVKPEGATPNPEAAAPLNPEPDRDGPKLSERDWLKQRKKERHATRRAIESAKPAEASNSEAEIKPTTEVTRETESETQAEGPEAEGSEGAELQTEAEPTEASQAESENYFPETLPELVEALGVESADFLQGITAPVKVNGEERQVPLQDLLKNYSSEAERNRLGEALAEERKAMQATAQQHEQEHQSRLQQADTFLHALQASINLGPDDQQLNQMLNSGQIDERGYLTARSERDQKVAAFNQAVAQRNQYAAEYQQKQQEAQSTSRKQEQDRLMDWRPEFQDPSKLSEFETALRSNLKDMGYGQERIEHFFGSWTLEDLKLIDKAMKYDELMAQEKPIKQRLHTLPKLQKPGPKRSNAQQANDVVLGARNRLKSTGSVKDGVALLRAQRARRNQTHGGSQ